MTNNLKIVFIHGINNQTTNYSQGLFSLILSQCRSQLKKENIVNEAAEKVLQKLTHHELMWADVTIDLLNRYLQLEYSEQPSFWKYLFQGKILQYPKEKASWGIDPLMLQIMYYIKDKGKEGKILREFDSDLKKIFTWEDIGQDDTHKKVIVVAHSLGSVIAYDYLMGFVKGCSLDPSVTVKSFITLGSPIPLFSSAMGHPDTDRSLPPNVERWVNVYSPEDGVARHMKPFFRNIPIEEYRVWSGGFKGLFPISAHVGYWGEQDTAATIASEVLKALDITST